MWHVSSRSGVATLRTAILLLLTYLLTIVYADKNSGECKRVPTVAWFCVQRDGVVDLAARHFHQVAVTGGIGVCSSSSRPATSSSHHGNATIWRLPDQ